MKKLCLLSGMMVLGCVVANMDAMQSEKESATSFIDSMIQQGPDAWQFIYPLLGKMKDTNFVNTYKTANGLTLLMVAIFQGEVGVAEKLITTYKADPNTVSSEISPLMFACQMENVDMVNLLCEHGANVNFTNKRGNSVRSCAQYRPAIANALKGYLKD